MMQKPPINEILTLSIDSVGEHGEGVCTFNGFPVFVEGALPGETVKGRVIVCKNTYAIAQIVEIVKASPFRLQPACALFEKCGGCQLMHMAYSKQLDVKTQRVIDAFLKYKIDPVNLLNLETAVQGDKVTQDFNSESLVIVGDHSQLVKAPTITSDHGLKDCVNLSPSNAVSRLKCLPSPQPIAYRNKIQFPARNSADGIALGLYAKGSNDLVPIDQCLVHCDLGEEVYHSVQAIIKQSGITAYNPATGVGELRHVLIKSAVNTREVLVILVTNGEITERLHDIAKAIQSRCVAVQGVLHNKHTTADNVVLGHDYTVLEEQDHIHERLCGLRFKVSPASFFQVNPFQAECLYAKALEFAALQGTESVLDAYCGVGTLSLLFAQQAKRVIGVECVSEAIEDANRNAELNEITNVTFVCDQAELFIDTLTSIDIVLLNPPRRGCERAFLKGIGKLHPKKIVYISCDPTSLARDLSYLCTLGYKVDEVQPYDMFPQTIHVECVVRLTMV